MGLFSRKPKISIYEFCREFYDTQIFHAMIGGIDAWSAFLETVFNSVVEADQSFAVIDQAVFQREMTALRMELFGLAWSHKFERLEFTLGQSSYTQRYLEENGRLDIWDIMGEYNKAIAQSTELSDRWAKVRDEWAKQEGDSFSNVARIVNRWDADIRRNDCILVKRLAAKLADRLGCDINLDSEALFRLQAVIFGFYNGAKEAIESVNLQV
jgi:hypothetical protein